MHAHWDFTLTEDERERATVARRARHSWKVWAEGQGLPAGVLVDMTTALDEAASNVARHSGASRMTVVADVDGGECRVLVWDDGRGFDPAAVPEPSLNREGGRGVFLMRALCKATIQSGAAGTRVTLRKAWRGRDV